MRIGMTTFGYLYRRSLESSLESIARAGYRSVEIAPVSPHLSTRDFNGTHRRRLKALLNDLELTCVSINPVELNLISTNPELRGVALDEYVRAISLAADLGAATVIVIAGRQSPLIPMPRAHALRIAAEQICRLLPEARAAGVTLAIETVPFGLTETAAEVADLVRETSDGDVGIALDAANVFGKEEPGSSVENAGGLLRIAHLSDSWRRRWAHTSLGRGEVDLQAFVASLLASGFSGPCIYELVDGEDPEPRIANDLALLKSWGVST